MILEKIVPQVEIATERFMLRPVRKSDAGLFALYAGDKRVAEATQGIPHPLPPGAAEAFCARAMQAGTEEDIWVMDGTRSALPEVLGVISLKTMDRGQSEVAFWVAPAFWNHGIASQAVQALVAANPQKNGTMFAEAFQDNPGSARVLTNAGFQYLGDAESHSVARGGKRADLDLHPQAGLTGLLVLRLRLVLAGGMSDEQ